MKAESTVACGTIAIAVRSAMMTDLSERALTPGLQKVWQTNWRTDEGLETRPLLRREGANRLAARSSLALACRESSTLSWS